MYEGMLAESIRIEGYGGDIIDGYLARPLGDGPYLAVVIVHHMPGWDESTKEIARKLAYHGYVAIMPNLHHRTGPGTASEQATRVREAGGNPDDQFFGDAQGSVTYLDRLPYTSGKIGLIGFCAGGRQAFLAACKMPRLNAAVDCWGGRVIATPEEITERHPISPIDLAPEMTVPLLGIFGNDDPNPSPDQVNKTEEILKKLGKTYEFHRYDGAGHGFFSVDRPGYRAVQATDAWTKIFAWFDRWLT